MARRLPRSFFARPTLDVARDLLGKVLVHRTSDGEASGMIVETEAYIGEDDPACHAAPGPTLRNRPLYGPAGYSYVYLNYGIHFLTNVVTEEEGRPAAVLLRALQPIDGTALMRRRRQRAGVAPSAPADHELCRGPGNLSRALGITLLQNWTDLEDDRLFLEDRGLRVGKTAWSPRIGLSVGTEQPWRCYVVGHPAVSGRAGRPDEGSVSGRQMRG